MDEISDLQHSNKDKVSKETNFITKQLRSAWASTIAMWLLLIFVYGVFFFMYGIIRVFPKHW